ncbi:MAG: hypothetical protein EOO16_12495 [Chitinophagaceae bacterium]|nr:MAG: hypothetical protein EOO16_12495 [Chitinophagaceae bacterium]
MRDKFANLEEPRSRALPAVVAAFLLIAAVFAYRLTHIKPIELSGTVESTVPAGQPDVPVILDNGSHVHAADSGKKPHSAGDKIHVLEQVQLFAAPTYLITENNS